MKQCLAYHFHTSSHISLWCFVFQYLFYSYHRFVSTASKDLKVVLSFSFYNPVNIFLCIMICEMLHRWSELWLGIYKLCSTLLCEIQGKKGHASLIGMNNHSKIHINDPILTSAIVIKLKIKHENHKSSLAAWFCLLLVYHAFHVWLMENIIDTETTDC